MWMKQMLKDIEIEFLEPIIIYYDKISIVSMSKNPILHSKNKNIYINYYFLTEKETKQKSHCSA